MYATQFWHTLYFWCNEQRIIVYRLPTILTINILARDIAAKIFHNRDISTHACFGPVGIPAHGHFVSVDISVQGLFDTGTFRHKDFSAMNVLTQGHYGTVAQVPKYPVPRYPWWQKFLEPKCPHAEKSLYWNVHGDEMSMCRYNCRTEACTCWSVLVMKCPCRNVSCQNVRSKISPSHL